jgi:galactose-1-phosphate uridylyltransferase
MNRSQKEALKEKIEKLDAQEHAQIFEVIKRYTETYTKTQNGVLVSSDSLPDECLREIEKMVIFYMDQRKRMDADIAERKTLSRM